MSSKAMSLKAKIKTMPRAVISLRKWFSRIICSSGSWQECLNPSTARNL